MLVADDDNTVRTLISTVLTRQGFVVEAVRNGDEAIQKIATLDYQAILLDLMMPLASGYEVITYLERTAPERLRSCVIVVTAVSTADLRRLDGKTFFRVVQKPFDLDDLVATVTECVESSSPVRVAGGTSA